LWWWWWWWWWLWWWWRRESLSQVDIVIAYDTSTILVYRRTKGRGKAGKHTRNTCDSKMENKRAWGVGEERWNERGRDLMEENDSRAIDSPEKIRLLIKEEQRENGLKKSER
jgi:hypothetical protein